MASAALLAACGGSASEPKVVIKPFDNVGQANITTNLRLFGGGGQWTINLTAVVHNTTSEPRVYKVHSTCPVALLAFNNSAGTGTPAWDSRTQMLGCKGELLTDTIAPGDSIILRAAQTNTDQILAHYGTPPANPPGQYFFFFSIPTDLTAGGEVRDFVGFSQLSP